MLATAGLAVYIPLDIIVPEAVNQFSLLYWAINLIFFADIPICYWATNEDSAGNDGINSNALIGHRRWLLTDIVAAVPIEVLTGNPYLRLLRLVKLLKIRNFMRFYLKREVKYNYPLTILFFIYWVALCSHWLSAGWLAMIGLQSELSFASNYIRSLYWVVTTLTSVGYGDIVPTTDGEYLYSMFVQIIGIGVLGYIVGNVAGFLTRKDPATVKYGENMDRLSALVRYRGLPKELQDKINFYYTYQWKKRSGYDEAKFLKGLPDNLSREVSLHLKNEVLEKIFLFQDASQEFIDEIALHLSPVVLTPNDVLFREGDDGDAMYFVLSGELVAVDKHQEKEFATFSDGDFFGEMALFKKEPRSATMISKTYSDLYKLDKKIFDRIMEHYPRVAKKIVAKAMARDKEHRNTAQR